MNNIDWRTVGTPSDAGKPDNSKTWHKGKCACVSPERRECYCLRYPNQMEEDGRDYCECPCHDGFEYPEEEWVSQ